MAYRDRNLEQPHDLAARDPGVYGVGLGIVRREFLLGVELEILGPDAGERDFRRGDFWTADHRRATQFRAHRMETISSAMAASVRGSSGMIQDYSG